MSHNQLGYWDEKGYYWQYSYNIMIGAMKPDSIFIYESYNLKVYVSVMGCLNPGKFS